MEAIKTQAQPAYTSFNKHTKPAFIDLEALNNSFKTMTAQQRVAFAYDYVRQTLQGRQLVLTSSYGVQSILMLSFIKDLGLDVPVLSVDIDDSKYDLQRAYRKRLEKTMGFSTHVVRARDDMQKVTAMDDGLRQLFAGATISGIRASQTRNREQKNFVEWNARNATLSFFPLLDWPDSKTQYYIEQFPVELRHPAYLNELKTQGGALLGKDDDKEECGLWLG